MTDSVAKSRSRSPLSEPALRNPGDSIRSEIEHLLDERALPLLFTASVALVLAIYEWSLRIAAKPPQPVMTSVFAVVAVSYAAWRLVPLRRRIKELRLGLEGEKAVSQYLRRNSDPEWCLLDDIPAGRFNVDHVLVAPQGIFVIETKTYSKPAKGTAKVVYDGTEVRVNGWTPDRDPVVQAAALRDWIREQLQAMTGKTYPVRGVVVVPGWWVDQHRDGATRPEVWVLNEKALPKWIRHETAQIAPEDVALAEDRLAILASR